MILTPEIEEQIIGAIKADPEAAVVLPDHAYSKVGRVVVLVDGLPVDLHRHLYERLIGPLGQHQRMHQASAEKLNVNPYLFTVVDGMKSPRTHCVNNHPYEGNEMPPNSRGYRCRICYLASRPAPMGGSNKEKTHCPQNHPYTEENTVIDSAGRRRCKICRRKQARDYKRRITAENKETS